MEIRARRAVFHAALAVAAAAAIGGCQTMERMGDRMGIGGGSQVTLSGAQEVPPVQTNASGGGRIRIADDRTVSGSVSFKGVEPTMAHIHLAPKGANGPVIVPLVRKGDTFVVPDGAKLTEAQYQAYKAGNLYVNVHSAQHPGGEIRGQIMP
ncbi:MAG TPA: CHRD domain-containing protein [Burkholderiaceae bacterium]|nr:CHRD domain-containing protein [Burkholderiaceae bacterium]